LGRGGEGEDDFHFDDWVERSVEAHGAAMQAVRNGRKTLTLAEATDMVTAIFTTHGLPAPSPESARALARGGIDPWWLLKHPVQAHREGWRFFPRDDD
jgi:hypothetical protein